MNDLEIRTAVRKYISEEIFNGRLPADFNDDTLLVSSRLMDSIVTLHMVTHFEDLLNIEFKAHEVSADNLDSINIISGFLSKKAKIA